MAQPKRKRNQAPETNLSLVPDRPITIQAGPLQAKTPAQRQYMASMRSNTLTVASGSAGTGKTYVALATLGQMLVEHKVERLILVRPLVETGRAFGALPGTLEEKMAPWALPMLDILVERLGKSFTEYLIKSDRIRVTPLEFMRGSTFNNTAVLLTEAQNTSVVQMKMFLSRLGEECKVIVDGDPRQSDLKGINGLDDALTRLQGLNSVGFVEFSRADIVRSGLCQEIVERYET